MMGSYGGSAFLLMYLLFTIVFAFPALVSEMALGQKREGGTIKAFASLSSSRFWEMAGYFFVFVVTVAGSYYVVVIANVLFTTVYSIFIGFEDDLAVYSLYLSNGAVQYGITVLVIGLTLYVNYLGVKQGIERISKIIMPFFGLSILYIIIYSWSLPGALDQGLSFIKPDFSLIGPTEIFAAMGQSFFSLGLGGTFVVVYAGLMNQKEKIIRLASFTSIGDLGSSVLVSLFLVPTILVFGLEMDSGPSLIFQTLPTLFSKMPGGRFIGSLFLLSLSLISFLSLVAAFFVPLKSLRTSKTNFKRMILIFGVIQLVLALPSVFYPSLIGTLDLIFGSGMQVLGSGLVVIGVWWGAHHREYLSNLFSDTSDVFPRIWKIWVKWIIPGTLLAVLLGYLIENLG